jgi:hypothetical protein
LTDPVLIALVGVVSAIAGGGVWSFLASWMKLGYTGRNSHLRRLEGDVTRLRTELSSCEERHDVLEQRLKAVENKTTSYFAMWIKDRNGRLVWLNDKAFLTIFAPLGYTRAELDGKTFRDLLDPAAADEIALLDKAALAHPGATQSLLVQLHPDLPFMVVIKVASISESGDVQYEGCAYNPSDPDIRNAIQNRRNIIQRSQSAQALMDGDEEEEGGS